MITEQTPDEGVRARVRRVLRCTGFALLGAFTGLLALFTVPALLLLSVLWFLRVGQPLVPPAKRWMRLLADRERRRLRRLGAEMPQGSAVEEAAGPEAARRELVWVLLHGTWGLILGAVVLQLLLIAGHDLTYPLWWELVSSGEQELLNGMIAARSADAAAFGPVIALLALLIWFVSTPRLLSWQSRPGLQLLGMPPGTDLSRRVAELTATRAAALDAHVVELRRIERALHDGAQNRIVGVAVLIGAARREIERDPARSDAILARAQDVTEDALAELRAVVRTILPPVLENRGLEGAVSALAADCPVPCTLVVDVPVRCPASVEATAYFVVAESLTNVAKHSRATRVSVVVRLKGGLLCVRVDDDGVGGADPSSGSGLAGTIRRVEALDGRASLTSPRGGPTTLEVELPCGS